MPKPNRIETLTLTLLISCAFAAHADVIPGHLSSMASQLLSDIDEDDWQKVGQEGTSGHAAIVKKAQAVLASGRMSSWQKGTVELPADPDELFDSLGLDSSLQADRDLVAGLLNGGDLGSRLQDARTIFDRGGSRAESPAQLLQAFDTARLSSLENGNLRHSVELDDGSQLNMNWRPGKNSFYVSVTPPSSGSEDWEVDLSGHVQGELTDQGTQYRVRADASPVLVMDAEELAEQRQAVFGEWQDQFGNVWQITFDESGAELEGTGEQQQKQQELLNLQEQLRDERAQEIYVWLNPETGQRQEMKKFRRLEEPWEYQSQESGKGRNNETIQTLEAKIAELESGLTASPVTEHDPVGFSQQGGQRQAMNIATTWPNGLNYRYDEAWFDGRRLIARRTYRRADELQDNLPQWVRIGLVASWAPPNWIELEAKMDNRTGRVELAGADWNLRVTYNEQFKQIKKMEDPWSKPLFLARSTSDALRDSDEGADGATLP